MFLFKVLWPKQYQQLLTERKRLRQQRVQLETSTKLLEKEKEDLKETHRREREDFQTQLDKLRNQARDYESLQTRLQKLRDQEEIQITEGINARIKELKFDPSHVETLWEDRTDLIELYLNRLYSLAKQFAISNKEMKMSRGLFLLLVDERNIVSDNFSEFHDGQTEHLAEKKYEEINQLPHIFSSNIDAVLNYMGDKVAIRVEGGETTGYEERDGALLINLKGSAFRSCVMVEGVRTHRVYEGVEALQKGSAKHNAAIYASSLDEVLGAIVVSEEDSEVVIFRNGRFVKHYDPFTNTEIRREQRLAQAQHQHKGEKADVKTLVENTVPELKNNDTPTISSEKDDVDADEISPSAPPTL